MKTYLVEWTVQLEIEVADHDDIDAMIREWTIFEALDHNAIISEPTVSRLVVDIAAQPA